MEKSAWRLTSKSPSPLLLMEPTEPPLKARNPKLRMKNPGHVGALRPTEAAEGHRVPRDPGHPPALPPGADHDGAWQGQHGARQVDHLPGLSHLHCTSTN